MRVGGWHPAAGDRVGGAPSIGSSQLITTRGMEKKKLHRFELLYPQQACAKYRFATHFSALASTTAQAAKSTRLVQISLAPHQPCNPPSPFPIPCPLPIPNSLPTPNPSNQCTPAPQPAPPSTTPITLHHPTHRMIIHAHPQNGISFFRRPEQLRAARTAIYRENQPHNHRGIKCMYVRTFRRFKIAGPDPAADTLPSGGSSYSITYCTRHKVEYAVAISDTRYRYTAPLTRMPRDGTVRIRSHSGAPTTSSRESVLRILGRSGPWYYGQFF